MKIGKHTVVALTYELEVDNEVIQSVQEDRPMEFIYGTGYLLPKFEEQILDKEAGDGYDFTLKAADAYGEEDPEAFVELSKDIFKVNGQVEAGVLTVGRVLPMQDVHGNRLSGTIDEVREHTVVMNFNHALAGADLHFTGAIVSVRPATEEELANGLYPNQSGCSPSACSSCSQGCS
ncbi:MAG: FKBP-type peptidyl-prolyl cis-trans isomerase [Bacteroidales bacterium]|nr:FKBP-type peptidyl-prolyl cis-trans isomerase [Bacteroidales bacterium]MCL2739044.1 FKBP-type peptidyl-prolyl cis-trans isomerase [Bacteroidales bacterium]